jgi:hypothetical protein
MQQLLNTVDASLRYFNSLIAHLQVTFKLKTLLCKIHAVKFHMVSHCNLNKGFYGLIYEGTGMA